MASPFASTASRPERSEGAPGKLREPGEGSQLLFRIHRVAQTPDLGLRLALEKPRTESAVRATRLRASGGQLEHHAKVGSAPERGRTVQVTGRILDQTGDGISSVRSSEAVEYRIGARRTQLEHHSTCY